MATVAISVSLEDVGDADLAVYAADRLSWSVEQDGKTIRLITAENISPARMLADFWTEVADILEAETREDG